MKKSELKQLIRECYKEVIIENSNPFFDSKIEDSKIEEESNPFFDSKIEDSKIEKESNPSHETLSEYSDINVEDRDIRAAYREMKDAVKNIVKKTREEEYHTHLKRIPLFKQILQKGFFRSSVEDYYFSTIANTKVNYDDYSKLWKNAVEKYQRADPEKPFSGKKLDPETKRKAEKLLQILKANNGEPLETSKLLTLTSRDRKDMIKIRCEVSRLFNILTLGIVKSEFTYLYVTEVQGTFAKAGLTLERDIAHDKNQLNKLGNAILESVERQNGTVTMSGRTVGRFDKFTSIYGRT